MADTQYSISVIYRAKDEASSPVMAVGRSADKAAASVAGFSSSLLRARDAQAAFNKEQQKALGGTAFGGGNDWKKAMEAPKASHGVFELPKRSLARRSPRTSCRTPGSS